MARPVDKEYRAAILGALDQKLLVSMGEINSYLKSTGEFRSYQSSRRMLIKMASEGLLFIHPQRLDKGEMVFTKNVMNQQLILKDISGDVVPLSQFIANLYSEEFPAIVDAQAATVIKHWLFDYIISADPSLFSGIREVPDPAQLKKRLQATLQMVQRMHAFLKHFLDADLHSPVARNKLIRELRECPAKQIEYLVTQKWLDDDGKHKQAS